MNCPVQTRYLLHVVKASKIVLEGQWFFRPSLFIQISLRGQPIYSTASKLQTKTLVWDERLKLKSNDPNAMLLVDLRSTMMMPGFSTSIGSTKVRIQDLEDLGCLTPDILLELFDNEGNNTGAVVVRFSKVASLPAAKPRVQVPTKIPYSVPPQQAPSDKKELQNAEYQSQDISMDQVERMVKQILAR